MFSHLSAHSSAHEHPSHRPALPAQPHLPFGYLTEMNPPLPRQHKKHPHPVDGGACMRPGGRRVPVDQASSEKYLIVRTIWLV